MAAACSRHLTFAEHFAPTAVEAERAFSSNVTNVVCGENESKVHELTVQSLRVGATGLDSALVATPTITVFKTG